MKPKRPEDLLSIPGVGKNIAQDLRDLGITQVSDLKGKNPEKLYVNLCALRGMHIDRCMLYVMRCAVYYAENPPNPPSKKGGDTNPELFQWWNWSDVKMPKSQ